MSSNHQVQVDVTRDEEDRIIEQRIKYSMKQMLSRPGYEIPPSRKDRRKRLVSLDKSIYSYEQKRRQPHTWGLINELCSATAARDILSWSLFPINELPEVILERIFSWLVTGSPEAEISGSRAKLASVCRRWRFLVVNMPELWSMISVRSPPPYNYLRTCIERAKAHPLSLLIDQRNPNWSRSESDFRLSPQDMRSLMSLVTGNMVRVQQLLLLADTWEEMLSALEALERAPSPRNLQRLEIHRSGPAYVNFRPPMRPPKSISSPFKLFGGQYIPSLIHVSLSGVNIDFSSTPFRGLRSLSLSSMAIEYMPALDEVLLVLEQSPLLEVLCFDGACGRIRDPDSKFQSRPIMLVHLSELVIGNLVPSYARYVLSMFSAPRLRRLSLKRLVSADFSPLIRCLTGKFPGLIVLSVEGLQVNSNNIDTAPGSRDLFISWLRTCPRIRYLGVSDVPNAFLKAFLPDPQAGSGRLITRSSICPDLEAFETVKWYAADKDGYREFLSGRERSRLPLRRFYVSKADWESMDRASKHWLSGTGVLSIVCPGSRPDRSPRYAV